MPPFVHLIADYGVGDPAFSEVVHRLIAEEPSIRVETTAVPPFSTVATGFWIEQLGVHNPPFDDLLIYSNTAPRTDEATPEGSALGGELCYLELDTGVPVVAVNAGTNLSFVKPYITEFRAIDTPAEGSQFRSRDFFPKRVAELATGDHRSLGEALPVKSVPDPPAQTVCYVDGYGNVKTSIRASSFDLGRRKLLVTINGVDRPVVVNQEAFADDETIMLVPGSAGGEDPYLELIERGGSAAAAFDEPTPGDRLRLG